MHEFAVTQSIFDIALETVRQNHGDRLLEVHVTVGNLTGIVEESLRFYFEAISRGTPADHARLVVHRQCATAHCPACGFCEALEPPFPALCPRCSSHSLRVRGGDALIVDRVVLSTAQE